MASQMNTRSGKGDGGDSGGAKDQEKTISLQKMKSLMEEMFKNSAKAEVSEAMARPGRSSPFGGAAHR